MNIHLKGRLMNAEKSFDNIRQKLKNKELMLNEEISRNRKNPMAIRQKELYDELQTIREKLRVQEAEKLEYKRENKRLRMEAGLPDEEEVTASGRKKISLAEYRNRNKLEPFGKASIVPFAGPLPRNIEVCQAIHIPSGPIGPTRQKIIKPRGGRKQKLRDALKAAKNGIFLTPLDKANAIAAAKRTLQEACPRANYRKPKKH